MSEIEIKKNQEEFLDQYSLEKRNYNIIVSGIDGSGKFEFLESIIQEYFNKNQLKFNSNLFYNPDVYHLSLPIYDKSGGMVKITSNEERLLYRFGFEDKIEGNRIGTEITINQIRDLSKFTSTSPKDKHKFVIINNVEDLNAEASTALLKTLEETATATIFFLLTSEISYLPETIKSRCHIFNFSLNDQKIPKNSFLDYFLFLKPNLKKILEEKNYMKDYDKIEDELRMLFKKEIDPLVISEEWKSRGIIIIDYLMIIFGLLMKGRFLPKSSLLKNLYSDTYEKISICPERSIEILKVLINNKKYNFSNLNRKFYFDNLLIVLNKNLY